MNYTYILESLQVPGKHYTGHTADLKNRLTEHNRGKCAHTAKYAPWKVHCYVAFETEESARSFERYLKSGSGRAFAKRHFESTSSGPWAKDAHHRSSGNSGLTPNHPQKIPRAEPVVWAPKTLKACLEWYRKSEKPDVGGKIVFLALGAFAGMRPSEIEGVVGERDGLQWDDIDFKQRHIRIRAEVAGKLAEPRYITFTEKPGSGLTKEVADSMWAALCKWIEPYRETSGPVTFRKCQRLVSPELRDAKLITGWPKDGLRHTWISSLLALGVSRDWVAELAGNSPGIIRTNYKRPLPERVALNWFSLSPIIES